MRRLVLGLAIAAAAWAPSVVLGDDGRIAEFVKGRLQQERQAGNLRGFNIDMRVENGTIWFKGYVADEAQEMLVLRTGQQAGHLGAVQVVDEIEVQGVSSPSMAPAVMNASDMPMMNGMNSSGNSVVNYQEASAMPAPVGMPMAPQQAYARQNMPAMQAGAPMPMPMAVTGQDSAMAAGSPNLPGYAWPGYAANPNCAGVSYPTQYSPAAWPYIGPFYPYPQVPLGWRRVELEWDDGWWYLDFHDR